MNGERLGPSAAGFVALQSVQREKPERKPMNGLKESSEMKYEIEKDTQCGRHERSLWVGWRWLLAPHARIMS